MRKMMRSAMSAAFGYLATLTPEAAAQSAPRGECPIPRTPYSVDLPVYDIMVEPAARAAVDTAVPGLLDRVPALFKATTLPSLSAVLPLTFVARLGLVTADRLGAVDAALARVTPSAEAMRARCARYDAATPGLPPSDGRPALLIFEKNTGYRDGPAIEAARAMLRVIADRRGWRVVTATEGGAIRADVLRRFDAVVWNNNSGDVLTLSQRRALRRFVERGGGFLALHSAAGDPWYYWDWYADTLIGARFTGHTLAPQFQSARVVVADPGHAITRGIGSGWTMTDEWYSFRASPRLSGARVLATLDEASYSPKMGKTDLAMGDHPIAWTRCVGDGRSFYTAIGHRPESYAESNTVRMIEQAAVWAMGRGETRCAAGEEVSAK